MTNLSCVRSLTGLSLHVLYSHRQHTFDTLAAPNALEGGDGITAETYTSLAQPELTILGYGRRDIRLVRRAHRCGRRTCDGDGGGDIRSLQKGGPRLLLANSAGEGTTAGPDGS